MADNRTLADLARENRMANRQARQHQGAQQQGAQQQGNINDGAGNIQGEPQQAGLHALTETLVR
ncbi:hypothetical protein TorRG33x02_188660, partial [Trema orientale]